LIGLLATGRAASLISGHATSPPAPTATPVRDCRRSLRPQAAPSPSPC
jgi:hypothetical protein